MERGDHRSEAEDDPRLLAESVGVGVAGVGAGDDLGGHRSSVGNELEARVCGEVRGVHGLTAVSSAAAAGVRSCTGLVLELEVEQSEALGMLYWVL